MTSPTTKNAKGRSRITGTPGVPEPVGGEGNEAREGRYAGNPLFHALAYLVEKYGQNGALYIPKGAATKAIVVDPKDPETIVVHFADSGAAEVHRERLAARGAHNRSRREPITTA